MTGAWRPRTPSAWAVSCPTRSRPASGSCSVRPPIGVVGVISPWNWPYTTPAELIAPALACGNTVVWTPAPLTAVCAVALARCIAEADVPPGVFNLVTGPVAVVGNEIAANTGVHGVAFIGSTTTGRLVAQAAAGKVALLEMGGNGPVVVMDDADVDAAVEATLTACYLCAGQSCTAGERIRPSRRARRVPREARPPRDRAGPARRPLRFGHHHGTGQQRAGGGQDGRARGRRGRPRRLGGGGRRAAAASPPISTGRRRSWPTSPPTHRSRPRRRSGRVAPLVQIDSLEQAIALTNASPDGLLSAIFTAYATAGRSSPSACARAGSTSASPPTTGKPPPVRRGARAPTAAWAASAARTSCSSSASWSRRRHLALVSMDA